MPDHSYSEDVPALWSYLGGRKFIFGLAAVGAGLFVHGCSPHGLTAEMLGLLTGLYGLFAGTNVLNTRRAATAATSAETSAYSVGYSSQPPEDVWQIGISGSADNADNNDAAAAKMNEALERLNRLSQDVNKLQEAQGQALAALWHLVNFVNRIPTGPPPQGA